MDKEVKRRKRKPSQRQIRALQLINQGYSVSKAMREAGYSRATAHNPNFFMKRKTTQQMLSDMAAELIVVGASQKYVAKKIMEHMNATKIDHSHTEPDREVPDYQTQQKAIEQWKGFMKETEQGEKGGVKRRLTIEEFDDFVNDGPEPIKGETIGGEEK